MAYKVIILYQLYMPSYFLGTFTEYPSKNFRKQLLQILIITGGTKVARNSASRQLPLYGYPPNNSSNTGQQFPHPMNDRSFFLQAFFIVMPSCK